MGQVGVETENETETMFKLYVSLSRWVESEAKKDDGSARYNGMCVGYIFTHPLTYKPFHASIVLYIHSPTGDLGKIAGVNGQNSEGMCQGGKPGTGKLYTDVCLCCSAHTSGCVVDGLGATAAF